MQTLSVLGHGQIKDISTQQAPRRNEGDWNWMYIQFHHVEDDLVPGSGRRCDSTMNSLESIPPQCHTDLQCLYCSYTVASVTLMRQHTVSHVTYTEAVKTILFSESSKELLFNDNDAAAVAASDSATCSKEDSPDTGSEHK